VLVLPPLSLYIHIPWCVQKCPYCDFNSHALKKDIPQQEYINALVEDLKLDLPYVQGRSLSTIFIGGGTPSLIEPAFIGQLLDEIKKLIGFDADIEITLEANPGTTEAQRFAGYQAAGVNRISIGVQSFEVQKLNLLGRIHDSDEAKRAVRQAMDQGFNSVNLDLMFGLPRQSLKQALDDLRLAIELNVSHLSWYQLTIEPNTAFFRQPPAQIPDDEQIWDIFEQGSRLLVEAGYRQYEVSAWAKSDYQCRHNLNYWRFGDYLGIGCGSHGKITQPDNGVVIRTLKVKHPKGYLDPNRSFTDAVVQVAVNELNFEYFLNRLRLFEAIPKAEYTSRTGLDCTKLADTFSWAKKNGLMLENDQEWSLTQTGQRYLNSILERLV